MISIGDFSDISSEYDEIWFIVRSLKTLPMVFGVKTMQVLGLAPSEELFYKFLGWKKNNEWNEETFEKYYVPRFLWEMQSEVAINTLKSLYELGKEKDILLVCYCKEEKMCHRSIVAGILQGMSNEQEPLERIKIVGKDFPCDDYSGYYEQYKKLNNKFLKNMQNVHWRAEAYFYCLVAGSRTYCDYLEFENIMDKMLQKQVEAGNHIVIVSGGAKGTDSMAEVYADKRGYEKKIFQADWDKYGRAAGYRRNEDMHLFICAPVDRKRACICFWDGSSKGTKHNFELAKKYGNELFGWLYNEKRLFKLNTES